MPADLFASPPTLTLALPLAAFGLGVLHMIEPGHGKLLVAAFVLQKDVHPLHIAGFGVLAALAHASILLALLLAAIWFQQHFASSQAVWFQGVQVLSALFVVGIGVFVCRDAFRPAALDPSEASPCCHKACVPLPHRHANPLLARLLPLNNTATLKELYLLGWASGLHPCPKTLALLLSFLQLSQAWMQSLTQSLAGGVYLIAFSAGMAGVMVGLALLVWLGKHTWLASTASWRSQPWVAPLLQWGRRGLSLFFLGMGLVLLWQALFHPPLD